MKRPYTTAEVLANLRIFADNLAKPPVPTERAWMRWVIQDIETRGIAFEGANRFARCESLLVKETNQPKPKDTK